MTVQCSVLGLRAGVVDQLAIVCGQRLELPGEDVLLHLQHLAAAPRLASWSTLVLRGTKYAMLAVTRRAVRNTSYLVDKCT